MSPKRTLLSVNVVDVEKRRKPSKHYVYVMNVSWSDGNLCRIARRFSSFFDMHMALLDKFPVEGGQKDPSKRVLPFLPGKLFFRRSHTRDVTMQRLGKISEYCQDLTKLPNHISQCDIIINFFQSSADDEKLRSQSDSDVNEKPEIRNITGPIETESYIAIADYKAEAKNQISMHVGEVVEVVDKSETGWWLVCNLYDANGFVPGAFLEKLDGGQDDNNQEEDEEDSDSDAGGMYVAKVSYDSSSKDELSFPAGALLEVVKKNFDGWWLVRNNNNAEGWAPASFLTKSDRTRSSSNPPARFGNGYPAASGGFGSSTLQVDRKLPPKRNTINRKLNAETRKEALRRLDTFDEVTEEVRQKYVTLFSLDTKVVDGLSFGVGQVVEVIEQSDNGWWFASLNGKEGWVPANYLGPVKEPESPPKQTSPATSPQANLKPWERMALNEKKQAKDEVSPLRAKPKPERPDFVASRPLPPKKENPPLKKQFEVMPEMLAGAIKNKNKVMPPTGFEPKPAGGRSPVSEEPEAEYVAMVNYAGNRPKRLEDESWFKDVGRVEAESALKAEGKEGYFIVRRSKSGGSDNPYSLTLYHRRSIFNFHVRRRRDGRYATGVYSEGEKTFASVQELVQFYHENTLVVGDETNMVKLKGTPSEYL